MTTWTQNTINEWAMKTFGPSTPQHMMARSIQEGAELLMEITKANLDQSKIAEECADIIGPLCRVCEFFDIDITPIFIASDFMSPNNLYGPAVKLMGRLTFVMERMGPHAVSNKSQIERQLGMIVIELAEICAGCNSHLGTEIDKKMKILQDRKWILDGNGAGRHISVTQLRYNFHCALGETCQPGKCVRRPQCDIIYQSEMQERMDESNGR